jgi:hypothetical protein
VNNEEMTVTKNVESRSGRCIYEKHITVSASLMTFFALLLFMTMLIKGTAWRSEIELNYNFRITAVTIRRTCVCVYI